MSDPARHEAADSSAESRRIYLCYYTAVSPDDGGNFSLILPRSDTEMMNIFLNELSEQYQEYEIIIAADGAPRHPSESSNKYDNIRVILRPPYSPEVSPVGHIWEYIRENDFHNRQSETSDIPEDKSVNVLSKSEENRDIVKSVTGFHRATVNV